MSPNIVHVLGARPNFVKAAPVIAALDAAGANDRIIHTGQHYDERLSKVFLDELRLPQPHYNLAVGSGSQADQTAALLTRLEPVLLTEQPDAVVVYGDVNSTLAGALVAAKLCLPLVHVEAGLRSFDRTMPEEVNRRVVDVLSDLHLVTSPEAVDHLVQEGVDPQGVHLVGNPMIDTLLAYRDRFDPDRARSAYGLRDEYGVVTVHRPANVDDPDSAGAVVTALHELAEHLPLVFPVHPRGRQRLEAVGLGADPRIHLIQPAPYVDFLSLVQGARLVITDSGGLQEETSILGIPCLTVRPNTERPITITHGTNRLVAADQIVEQAVRILAGHRPVPDTRPPLWDGQAAPRCARRILEWLASRSS